MTIQHISAKDLSERLAKGKCQLIDIREAQEFARESIPGARNIPMSALSTCACPPGKTLVFHCKSGMRTKMAAAKLAEWAGRDVLILDGGIEAWRRLGEGTTKAANNTPAGNSLLRRIIAALPWNRRTT